VLGSLTIPFDTTVSLPALELVRDDLAISTLGASVILPALRTVGASVSVECLGSVKPSLAMLESIGKDLLIDGAAGQSGLIDAPSLREVDGDLVIRPSAKSDVALPALQEIHGKLNVQLAITGLHLDRLAMILGGIDLAPTVAFPLELPSLSSLRGDLRSTGSSLTSIELPALELLSGNLRLENLPLSKASLPRLATIEGQFIVGTVPQLTTLDINRLAFVYGDFVISGAAALVTLELPSLVQAHQVLIQETGIEDIEFAALYGTAGDILLPGNNALRSVALPALGFHPGGLAVYNSPALESVVASQIEQLGGLAVNGGGALHTVSFPALQIVDTDVRVSGGSLPDLSGLHALFAVGTLSIDHIDQLRDLRSLPLLRRLDRLQITSAPALASLAGLEKVTQLAVSLELMNNPALTSLDGLQHVTSAGALRFVANTALPDLSLPGLVSVDQLLQIQDMSSLAHLSGLDPLRAVNGEIIIENNPLLSPREIDAFRDRF
jgi:hypothetical protein